MLGGDGVEGIVRLVLDYMYLGKWDLGSSYSCIENIFEKTEKNIFCILNII